FGRRIVCRVFSDLSPPAFEDCSLDSRKPTAQGRPPMTTARTPAVAGLGFVLSTQSLQAQNRPEYRGFQLGGSVLSVSTLTKVAASEARTIHLRPAFMQELQWRPSFFLNGSGTLQTDSVRQIVFSFYNDQLSKMAVDYDTDRTAGMTDADMSDAISTKYGPPSNAAVQKTEAGRS